MSITLYGMAWLLTAMATTVVAFLGGLVQLLVMVARAPAGERPRLTARQTSSNTASSHARKRSVSGAST